MPTTRNVAILVFEDVEVLDFCGPFEVFTVANRFTDPPAFHVFTVAEKPGPVLTRGGLSVNPHHRLADCPRPDLLLVPGGQGTRREMHNTALTDWIKARSQEAELVLSVCTGALLLATPQGSTTARSAAGWGELLAPLEHRAFDCQRACSAIEPKGPRTTGGHGRLPTGRLTLGPRLV